MSLRLDQLAEAHSRTEELKNLAVKVDRLADRVELNVERIEELVGHGGLRPRKPGV